MPGPGKQSSGGGYTITGSGTNSQVCARPCLYSADATLTLRPPRQGNHYCNRDYGPSAPNQNAYHYSNTNGSYYYSNPNGST